MDIGINSHIGKVRETNQDYVAYFTNADNQLLAVLCDGMGGHNAGDVASEMAAVHMGHEWETTQFHTIDDITQWVQSEINKENHRIYEKSLQFKGLEGMGTTLVSASILGNKALISNIGDSRAYHFKQGFFQQVTEDHSFVNELMKRGEISLEESKHHPNRNILVRSLGVEKDVEVDFFEVTFDAGDSLLLCSDGLYHLLSEEEMTHILNRDVSAQEKAEWMVSRALEQEASDNISVILIENKKEGGK